MSTDPTTNPDDADVEVVARLVRVAYDYARGTRTR